MIDPHGNLAMQENSSSLAGCCADYAHNRMRWSDPLMFAAMVSAGKADGIAISRATSLRKANVLRADRIVGFTAGLQNIFQLS